MIRQLSIKIGPTHLLACASCGSSEAFHQVDDAAIECGDCGAKYSTGNGVIDFVAGQSKTELENIDYDEFYDIDTAIDNNFQYLKNTVGEYLDRNFTRTLEIGAGTGGLTVGLLKNLEIEEAIITDISPMMLAKCQGRLTRLGLTDTTKCTFATNNGTDLCVRDNAFDAVIGYFVVHHVLDYRRLLQATHAALRPGGLALFAEPNQTYYKALLAATSPALARYLKSRESWPAEDLHRLIALIYNMHFSLKYQGNEEVLRTFEDKHMFKRAEFEDAARAAGFSGIQTLPFGIADPPLSALAVFGKQISIGDTFMDKFIREASYQLPGPFSMLDPIDTTPSLVYALQKADQPRRLAQVQSRNEQTAAREAFSPRKDDQSSTPKQVRTWTEEAAALRPPMSDLSEVELKADLLVTCSVGREGTKISVDGWVVARRPVQFLVMEIGSERFSALVGGIRIDVFDSLIGTSRYSLNDILYSGVTSDFESQAGRAEHQLDNGDPFRILAELDNGQIVEVADGLVFENGSARVSRFG